MDSHSILQDKHLQGNFVLLLILTVMHFTVAQVAHHKSKRISEMSGEKCPLTSKVKSLWALCSDPDLKLHEINKRRPEKSHVL